MTERQLSRELFQKACSFFPGGVNSPARAFGAVDTAPLMIERGEGAYLFDVDGRRYIDFIGSWGPLVMGHAHPQVLQALAQQAERGTSFGTCCPQEQELAELVQQLMPSLEMLRFVNSGTEAAMSVIRLARAFTKRSRIVKFTGNYHGHVDALLTKAGSGVSTLGLPDSPGVPAGVASDTISLPYNSIEAVREVFSEQGQEIAAVIVEPVVGNSGFIMPEEGFLEGLRDCTAKNNALLIFDEVMTGFRVDLHGAQGLFNITPDLTMLGKVIGGGLPVGAFGGRKEIMELLAPLGPVYQAGTLSGNPLAMVAGCTTLKLWCAEGAFQTAVSTAQSMANVLSELGAQHGIPVVAKSCGSMFGFFFHEGPVHSFEDAQKADAKRFTRFFSLLLERGVYVAQSPFEAGFCSAAHDTLILEEATGVLQEVFPLLAVEEM